MTNQFNLIDEPWIPIVGREKVSLKQLFSHSEYAEIGGNPTQKIALTKLLLAIAQSAHTPKNEEECLALRPPGIATSCLAYLEKQRDAFWLYGEKPFLQMPAIKKAKKLRLSAVLPDVATGNNALVFETQKDKPLENADKALLILTIMGFALGGKKTDNTISITEGYEKKATGKPGTAMGYLGYLHSFLVGSNVQETIWLNLLTGEQLAKHSWNAGIGVPPWEEMPKGEDCPVARRMKDSYLGRLVPLSRFCLLAEDDIHYSEGIHFGDHKQGGVDPSIAVDRSKKEWKAMWVDPEKRPWRMITSFLSYLGKKNSFDCLFIKEGTSRAKELPLFGIWSGGLRVSSNAGEQYVSGSDDFVESKIILSSENIGNSEWFWQIEEEMDYLDHLSKAIQRSVFNYYKQLKTEGSKHAQIAANLFWELCEKHAQELFQSETPKHLRKKFYALAISLYDRQCPKGTARQIDSWANNKPIIKIS